MPSLLLGPVSFADFELPADIVFGGRQRLAVHTLAGGARVIDAMGRDDAPLAWSGAFSGPDATPRARALDLLRTDGLAWPLRWADFAYTVVVADFAARYERVNWVPYRIVCTVLADDAATPAPAAPTLSATLAADLASAGAFAGLDLAATTAALAAAGALSAGTTANTAAAASLAAAAALIADGVAGNGALLGTDGDFPTLAAAAGLIAGFAAARGFVGRAQGNLARAGT